MLLRVIDVGVLEGISGWNVNSTHVISGWSEWEVTASENRPLFADTNTVCYTFPSKSIYYREVEKGNRSQTLVPPIPIPIPISVTMRQGRLALLGAGLLSQIETSINSLPEPQRSAGLIEWEYSNDIQRYNGFVDLLAPSLNLTNEQIDNLFIVAATL